MQEEVDSEMRRVLIDWLVDVTVKFSIGDKVIFSACDLVDLFLRKESIETENFQLLGITCLMIQAKIYEIYPPTLKDYIVVCDYAYEEEDFLLMEARILTAINFKVNNSYSFDMMSALMLEMEADREAQCFGQFVLECFLLSEHCSTFSDKIKCISSILLLCDLFELNVPDSLREYITNSQVEECCEKIYETMETVEEEQLEAINSKYFHDQYCRVSQFKLKRV